MRAAPVLVPSLRLGVNYASSAQVTPEVGAAHFHILAGRLETCPLRFEKGRAALVPCLSGELGVLVGSAEPVNGIVETHNPERRWLAFGQSVALELSVVGPVYVALVAEIREPVDRYDFIFEQPYAEVSRVPKVELSSGLAAGVRFWRSNPPRPATR
jgi:hypothetical protein